MSSDSENIENNEKIENSDDVYRVFYDVNGTLERNPAVYRRKEIPSLVVDLVIREIIYPRICKRHGYTQADVEQTDISVYNVSAEDFKAIRTQAKRDSAVALPTNGLVEGEDEIGKRCLVVLRDRSEGPHLRSFIHIGDLHKFQQVDLHHNKIIRLAQDSLPSFVRTFLETLGSKRFFPEDEHAWLSKELEKTGHQTTKLFAASDVSIEDSAVSLENSAVSLENNAVPLENNAVPLESLENSIVSLKDNAALQASAREVDHYISLHKFLVALDRISTLIQTNGLQEVTSRVFFVDLGINLLLSMKSFRRDRRVAIYPSTKPWPIKQLVLTVVDQTPPTYFSYKPKSDFGIWEVLPRLLTETQSQADKEDYYRLLLQGGSIVRLVSAVQKEDEKPRQFILPLVYVDQLWQDVRFLLMFLQQDGEVCYFEKVFDLTLMDDSLCFLLHLYNLLDYIRSVNDEALRNHVSNAFARLSSIQTSGSKTRFKRKTEDNNQSPRKRNRDEESRQIGELARQHRYRLEIEHEGSGVHFGTSPDGIKVAVKRGCSVELAIYDYLRELKDSPRYVLPIFDVLTTPTASFLVFPWLESMRDVINSSSKKLSSNDFLALSLDLASGLCFLHRHLVAHLDVKPDNLVLATDHPDSLMFFATQPVLKIIDFNLAARVAREDELLTLFQGTEGYMAPEVCRGEPFLPFKADLFSCGRVFLDFSQRMRGSDQQTVVAFAEGLTADDPQKRPHLEQWLSSCSVAPSRLKESPTLAQAHLA